MTSAILTPIVADLSLKIGRKRYRKRILPLDSIDYKGTKIDFNEEYLGDLVQSFTDMAYDQVPFVLADANNAHNELPDNFRGELDAVQIDLSGPDGPGLYGDLLVNREGAKLLESNPKLGVSARIIEGLAKSDGRVFKRVIRHVCGTLDPRVSGLGPWRPVDLSDEVDETIETVDLSAASFQKGTKEMAKAKTKSIVRKVGGKQIDLSKLSDEQFSSLLDLSAALAEGGVVEDEVELDAEGAPIVRDEEGNRIDPATGEVIEEVDEEDDTDAEVVDDSKEIPAPPSPTTRKKRVTTKTEETDLSNILNEQTRDEVTQMRIDLAAERFDTRRTDLIRAGVPPFLVDLAADILSSPDATVIDLSNTDEPVNATEVINKMLDGVKGMVDLTPEIGHSIDLSVENDEDSAALAAWDNQYGSL